MNNKTLNKLITITIYLLTSLLTILILYNIILLFNKHYSSNEMPRNSIKVSPISGEEIHSVSNMNKIYKVNYKNLSINKLTSISKASIIYDAYDETINSTLYSALFLDKNFSKENAMLAISPVLIKDLPNIAFIDKSQLKNYSYIKLIDSIILTNSYDSYSNFFYYNGEYHHFTKSLEDKDPISNKSITYKNIVIDVSTQIKDTIYVYSAGLFKQYNKGEKLFLSNGKTYWCILNKNSSIHFSFSDLDSEMQNSNNTNIHLNQ